jgi:MIP family channel proteins
VAQADDVDGPPDVNDSMERAKWCADYCKSSPLEDGEKNAKEPLPSTRKSLDADVAKKSTGDGTAKDASVKDKKLNKKAVAAEFLAMTLFVVIGCGSACGIAKAEGSAWVLQVSLTFGFAISVLAYSIGHISGGQINCAVTFGLWLAGELPMLQGVFNLVAQLAGSVVGAFVVRFMYPDEKDLTGGIGSNGVGEGFGPHSALVGEVVGTFLLMYVVMQTAVDADTEANRALAPVAIGLAVFLAHSLLIPIDGCSINPTRSFGPAVVASLTGKKGTFQDMWIFWLGPLAGATLAICAYKGQLIPH